MSAASRKRKRDLVKAQRAAHADMLLRLACRPTLVVPGTTRTMTMAEFKGSSR